jgi:hypothetical protein
LFVTFISAFATFLSALLDGDEIKGMGDGFWDWVVYNLFWFVQPIKALIRFFKINF